MQKLKEVTEILENQFGVKSRTQGTIIKLNVHEIECLDIIVLNRLSLEKACDLKIKRSGTGMVIMCQIL